jgi:hypothetical protein
MSVPRRSESEEIASRYCERIEETLTRLPLGGKREERPVRGGGGGERILWRVSLTEGVEDGNSKEWR